jgi:hypothetical protein
VVLAGVQRPKRPSLPIHWYRPTIPSKTSLQRYFAATGTRTSTFGLASSSCWCLKCTARLAQTQLGSIVDNRHNAFVDANSSSQRQSPFRIIKCFLRDDRPPNHAAPRVTTPCPTCHARLGGGTPATTGRRTTGHPRPAGAGSKDSASSNCDAQEDATIKCERPLASTGKNCKSVIKGCQGFIFQI